MWGQAPIARNTFHQMVVNLTWSLPKFCWRYWPIGKLEMGDIVGVSRCGVELLSLELLFISWLLNSLGRCPSPIRDMDQLGNLIWGTPVGVSQCGAEILLSGILFIKWSLNPVERCASSVGDMDPLVNTLNWGTPVGASRWLIRLVLSERISQFFYFDMVSPQYMYSYDI